MDSPPEAVDLRHITGARARAVLEIVDDEGGSAALQVDLSDGSSLFCIVWSDWRLVIDHRRDVALADYFWPPEKFSATPILTDVPEAGWKVLSAVASTDEVGQVMRIDLDLDGRTITARSFGGEIVIETTLPKPKPHNAHAASSAGEVGHGDPAVPIASAAGPSRRGGSPAAR